MCASRWSAFWPQVVAISLIAFGAASCSSDSGRFSDIFGSDSSSRNEVTGSIPPGASAQPRRQPAPAAACQSRCAGHLGRRSRHGLLPAGEWRNHRLAAAHGSPPPPPPPTWTWEGGTPITVAPGETLEMIARRHGVPVAAIMQANNITSPAMVHAGAAPGDPPLSPVSCAPTRHRRRASLRPHRPCPVPCRSVRREPRSRRPRACMSWRRARHSTASRGSMASRCWCSPRPTIFRRTPW